MEEEMVHMLLPQSARGLGGQRAPPPPSSPWMHHVSNQTKQNLEVRQL
jgi:hypothetical protein